MAEPAQAHIVVQLKDNQPDLLQQVQADCSEQPPLDTVTTVTRGRNRSETRTVTVFKPDTAGLDPEWQPLVKQIIQVSRNVLRRSAKTGLWNSTSEIAYYLSNRETTAGQFAGAIRDHWRIENTLHYTRDVTFLEDHSRIRTDPGIFARIRSFAYNILRCHRTSSFNQARYAAALGGLDALLQWGVSGER